LKARLQEASCGDEFVVQKLVYGNRDDGVTHRDRLSFVNMYVPQSEVLKRDGSVTWKDFLFQNFSSNQGRKGWTFIPKLYLRYG